MSNKYSLTISLSISYVLSLVLQSETSSSNFQIDLVVLVTLSNNYKTSITIDNTLEELSKKEIDEFELIIQNNIKDSNILVPM